VSDRPHWRDLPPIDPEAQPHFPEDWTPSQTFLRIHDNCDRAALLYLKHGGGAATHELNRGSLVHETLERLLRMLVASQRERAADLDTEPAADYVIDDPAAHAEDVAVQLENSIPPELGRQVLYEVMADNPELQISAEERDACRYMVDHWCRGTERNGGFEPGSIIGIEKTLTLETGGFRVLVRPDLIRDLGGGVCRIDDWKTAWPPDSEDFRAQAYDAAGNPRWAGNYQLNMGAVVAAFGVTDDGLPLGNFNRFQLALGFPRILREDGIDERIVEVDRLQLESFREDLDLQLHRLREVCMGKRKWQATAGNHCGECPAEVACPLPRVLRPESQMANLTTLDDLEEAANKHFFMQRSGERLKRRIKKAAESMVPEDLDTFIVDGKEVRGVAIGAGDSVALVFVDVEKTEVIDRENLLAAAEAAANLGEPFDRNDHVKRRQSVEFVKRKIGAK
jgi:hypothetical protein